MSNTELNASSEARQDFNHMEASDLDARLEALENSARREDPVNNCNSDSLD
jgi:hypothetical protein